MAGETYAIAVEGLTNLTNFEELREDVVRSARQAINKATDRARAEASRRIREEVNFTASYLSPSAGRLKVSKYASGTDLEGRVRAQSRATSLARFVTGSPRPGVAGVPIEVEPGKARFLRTAFLVRLPQGRSAVTETRFNMGLAVRLKPGETLRNKARALKLESNLYLLYGPSVQQAFINASGGGVAEDISPNILDFLENEFLRLQGR